MLGSAESDHPGISLSISEIILITIHQR